MTDFSQLFKIIYEKYTLLAKKHGAAPSLYGLARLLGVSHSKTGAWEKGQWPSAKDCAAIEKLLGFSLRWVVTGEGDPEGADAPTPSIGTGGTASEAKAPAAPPVPMLGFAGCSVQGIGMVTPFAVAVSPVVFSPRTVAVVASGESMVPAGIANGHVCYCDPELTPMPGEVVFFRSKDGTGALKVYMGQGTREGSHVFQGWLPVNDEGKRKEFEMDVDGEQIESIAPVVFVRRRL